MSIESSAGHDVKDGSLLWPIGRSSLPAGCLPQALIDRSRLDGNPAALIRLATATDHFAYPHMAVEVRDR